MADYSSLSNEDLLALKGGDYSKVSNQGLLILKGGSSPQQTLERQIGKEAANEPGLQDVSATPITDKDLNQAGEDIATSKLGQKHPIASAALGTVVAKLPDFVAAAQGIGEAPAMARAAEAVGTAVKSGAKAGGSRLMELAKLMVSPGEKASSIAAQELTGPAEQALQEAKMGLSSARLSPPPELASAQEQVAGLGQKYGQKAADLSAQRASVGKAMGAVEEKAGIGLKELPPQFDAIVKDPEAIAKRANVMAKLADKGPEYLGKTLDPATLQINRKLAGEALKNPSINDLTRVQLYKAKAVFADALGEHAPELKPLIQQFKETDQALRALPAAKKAEADSLRLSIKQTQNQMKGQILTHQQKVQEAQKALQDLMPKAQELIQRGQKADVVRNRALKTGIAVGSALAGPRVLKHL